MPASDSTIACGHRGAVLEESRNCSATGGDGARIIGGQTGRKLHLVYKESPDGDSLVFPSLDRAIEIDRLRRAIQTSETWGESRRRIDPEAHAELFGGGFYNPGPDDCSLWAMVGPSSQTTRTQSQLLKDAEIMEN